MVIVILQIEGKACPFPDRVIAAEVY